MFASRRESFLNYVCGIMAIVTIDYDVRSAWKKHLGTMGSMYVSGDAMVDDEWAHKVIDDALSQIE